MERTSAMWTISRLKDDRKWWKWCFSVMNLADENQRKLKLSLWSCEFGSYFFDDKNELGPFGVTKSARCQFANVPGLHLPSFGFGRACKTISCEHGIHAKHPHPTDFILLAKILCSRKNTRTSKCLPALHCCARARTFLFWPICFWICWMLRSLWHFNTKNMIWSHFFSTCNMKYDFHGFPSLNSNIHIIYTNTHSI